MLLRPRGDPSLILSLSLFDRVIKTISVIIKTLHDITGKLLRTPSFRKCAAFMCRLGLCSRRALALFFVRFCFTILLAATISLSASSFHLSMASSQTSSENQVSTQPIAAEPAILNEEKPVEPAQEAPQYESHAAWLGTFFESSKVRTTRIQ